MTIPLQHLNCGLCPACGSVRTKVVKSQKPRRQVVCKVCGYRFNTIEVIAQPDGISREVLAALLIDRHIDVKEMLSLLYVPKDGYM